MKRTAAICVVLVFSLVSSVYAIYTVSDPCCLARRNLRMNRRRMVLVVLASMIVNCSPILAQGLVLKLPADGSPEPRVISQWQQTGAVFGWSTIDSQGAWRFHREQPASGGLPAFRFSKFRAEKVKTLVAPGVPFVLWLGRSTKDADLEVLAGLNHLQALNFDDTYSYGVTVRTCMDRSRFKPRS